MVWDIFDDKPRKSSITAEVKREVYARAGGKCERCGMKLKQNQGNFHHLRSNAASAKSYQFLCPNCHHLHGHEHKTKVNDYGFYTEKKRVVKRKKVAPVKRSTKASSSNKSSGKGSAGSGKGKGISKTK